MALQDKVAAKGRIRLGTLLLRAGVIKPEVFSSALERSKQTDSAVGTILFNAGHLSQEDLSAALYLQSLIAEGLLPMETAVEGLHICHTQGSSPQAALRVLGWKPAIQPEVDEIEVCLVEAGFVSEEVYTSVAKNNGSAFDLVTKGLVYSNHFNTVLKAVSLVRTNVCTLGQAKQALEKYRTAGIPLEDSFRRLGIHVSKNNVRLGDILVRAHILSEAEMLLALEKSIRTKTRLGECVSGAGIASDVIDLCLQVQGLASSGLMDTDIAVKIIQECLSNKLSLASYLKNSGALAEDTRRAAVALDILLQAKLIRDKDILESHELTRDFGIGPIAGLLVTKRIAINIYNAIWYCDGLMQRNLLRPEQVIVAVQWCDRTGGEGSDAVQHISGMFTRLSDAVKIYEEERAQEERAEAEAEAEARRCEEEAKRASTFAAFFIAGVALFLGFIIVAIFAIPELACASSVLTGSAVFALYTGLLAFLRNRSSNSRKMNRGSSAASPVRLRRP